MLKKSIVKIIKLRTLRHIQDVVGIVTKTSTNLLVGNMKAVEESVWLTILQFMNMLQA